MTKTALVLAAIFIGASACGAEPPPPATGGPDTPVSESPGTTAPGPRGPQRVAPRDGLVDVRPTSFDRAAERDGGRAVDLFFWSGIEECYGIDRIEVGYRAETVVLTIFEGRVPSAEVCIELAVRKVVRVDLDEPVGDRAIVDGGAGG